MPAPDKADINELTNALKALSGLVSDEAHHRAKAAAEQNATARAFADPGIPMDRAQRAANVFGPSGWDNYRDRRSANALRPPPNRDHLAQGITPATNTPQPGSEGGITPATNMSTRDQALKHVEDYLGELGMMGKLMSKPAARMAAFALPDEFLVSPHQFAQQHPGLTRASQLAGRAGMIASSVIGAPKVADLVLRGMEMGANQVVGGPRQYGMEAGYAAPTGWGAAIDVPSAALTDSFMRLASAPDIIGSMFGQGDFTGASNIRLPGVSDATYEGIQANYRAWRRGLNPFDSLSQQEARNIVEMVNRQGLTGDRRVSYEDAISDLVKRIGIEAGDAIALLDLAVRRLNVDVDDAKQQIEGFGIEAKAAGKGLSEYTQEVLGVAKQAADAGGSGTTPLRFGRILSSMPMLSGETFTQLMTQGNGGALLSSLLAGQNLDNPAALQTLASGNPLGFITSSDQRMNQGISSTVGMVQQIVDQLRTGDSPDEMLAAFTSAAQILGISTDAVRKIYNQGDSMVRQASVYNNSYEALFGEGDNSLTNRITQDMAVGGKRRLTNMFNEAVKSGDLGRLREFGIDPMQFLQRRMKNVDPRAIRDNGIFARALRGEDVSGSVRGEEYMQAAADLRRLGGNPDELAKFLKYSNEGELTPELEGNLNEAGGSWKDYVGDLSEGGKEHITSRVHRYLGNVRRSGVTLLDKEKMKSLEAKLLDPEADYDMNDLKTEVESLISKQRLMDEGKLQVVDLTPQAEKLLKLLPIANSQPGSQQNKPAELFEFWSGAANNRNTTP